MKNERDDDTTLTVEEAAAMLKVNAATIQRELRAKRLPGNTVGRAWRIRLGDLREYLKTQPDRMNEGESAFRTYIESAGLPFGFEAPVAGTSHRPDFSVTIGRETALFEVKQFHPTPADLRGGFGAFDPYAPIREKINAVRKQFQGLKGIASCSLVLYNNGKPFVFLDPIHVYGAMLGDLGMTFPIDPKTGRGDASQAKTVFGGGGGMLRYKKGTVEPVKDVNTTISSIVVVSQLNLGQRRILIEARRREHELRRDLSPEEMLALYAQLPASDPRFTETPLHVCVHENPRAIKRLTTEFGRGSWDQRFGVDETGLGRLFAGSALQKLEAEEAEVRIKCDPWTGAMMHQSQALRAQLEGKK